MQFNLTKEKLESRKNDKKSERESSWSDLKKKQEYSKLAKNYNLNNNAIT